MSEQSRAAAAKCIEPLTFHTYAAGMGDLGSGEAIDLIADAIDDAVREERDREAEFWKVALALADRMVVQTDNPPLGNAEALAERSKRINMGGAVRTLALMQLGQMAPCLRIEPTPEGEHPFELRHDEHDDDVESCPIVKLSDEDAAALARLAEKFGKSDTTGE